jgi:hypothetical protein
VASDLIFCKRNSPWDARTAQVAVQSLQVDLWYAIVVGRLPDNQYRVSMSELKKNRLAQQVADLRVTFDLALSNKRRYPVQEFKAFVQSARRYIELTAGDPLVHKCVARAVNGLREFLEVERKRIPGDILFEAERLECQFFASYDPKFDGDEPPEL